MALDGDRIRYAGPYEVLAKHAGVCAGTVRYRADCCCSARLQARLPEPVERRNFFTNNDRPEPLSKRILGSSADRHASADLLPAPAAVIICVWTIGTRRPGTERGFRDSHPLRGRNAARFLFVARHASGAPAAHRRVPSCGMVRPRDAPLRASAATVDTDHPGLPPLCGCDTWRRQQSAKSDDHAHRSRGFGLIHPLFRVSRGCGGFCDLSSDDGEGAQGHRRFRRLQYPCPIRSLGLVPFPVRRYAAGGMDHQFSIRREHGLVQLPVVRWDGVPRALRRCGLSIICDARMARSWGVEYSDLCVHSGVRSDVGGGSGDLAPYSDPDKPQHDRRPSGSLRDLGGAGFLPGATLGPICGRRVSCYPNRADEPADSRLLYERNEGRVARYNHVRLEHSRLEAGTIYVY